MHSRNLRVFACPYLPPPDPIPSWQLEAVELQNTELLAAAHEAEQERTRLRDELKAAVDKVGQCGPLEFVGGVWGRGEGATSDGRT